jgi:hypothetical protein
MIHKIKTKYFEQHELRKTRGWAQVYRKGKQFLQH